MTGLEMFFLGLIIVIFIGAAIAIGAILEVNKVYRGSVSHWRSLYMESSKRQEKLIHKNNVLKIEIKCLKAKLKKIKKKYDQTKQSMADTFKAIRDE